MHVGLADFAGDRRPVDLEGVQPKTEGRRALLAASLKEFRAPLDSGRSVVRERSGVEDVRRDDRPSRIQFGRRELKVKGFQEAGGEL